MGICATFQTLANFGLLVVFWSRVLHRASQKWFSSLQILIRPRSKLLLGFVKFIPKIRFFFLPDCHTIAFANLVKMAICSTFQNLAIFGVLVVFWSRVLHRASQKWF